MAKIGIIKKLLSRGDKPECFYCGKNLKVRHMEIDHVTPRKLGGKSEIDNYRICCGSCNSYKWSNSIEQLTKKKVKLEKRLRACKKMIKEMKYRNYNGSDYAACQTPSWY